MPWLTVARIFSFKFRKLFLNEVESVGSEDEWLDFGPTNICFWITHEQDSVQCYIHFDTLVKTECTLAWYCTVIVLIFVVSGSYLVFEVSDSADLPEGIVDPNKKRPQLVSMLFDDKGMHALRFRVVLIRFRYRRHQACHRASCTTTQVQEAQGRKQVAWKTKGLEGCSHSEAYRSSAEEGAEDTTPSSISRRAQRRQQEHCASCHRVEESSRARNRGRRGRGPAQYSTTGGRARARRSNDSDWQHDFCHTEQTSGDPEQCLESISIQGVCSRQQTGLSHRNPNKQTAFAYWSCPWSATSPWQSVLASALTFITDVEVAQNKRQQRIGCLRSFVEWSVLGLMTNVY